MLENFRNFLPVVYVVFVFVPMIVLGLVADRELMNAIREQHPGIWAGMNEVPEVPGWDRPRRAAYRAFVRDDRDHGDARVRRALDFRRGIRNLTIAAFVGFLFIPFLFIGAG